MASERQLLEEVSPWWGEHVHRYEVALKYLNTTDNILDIACGTGFGSDILARNTSGNVIGGDIAEDAVVECRKNWQRKNLSFEVLDGTALKYGDGYFDAVVSFETIEHTTQYKEMLQEFKRVITPKGVAVISTPNFLINSPGGVLINEFHTQEFVYEELKEILEEVFPFVEIFGQHYARYDNPTFKMKLIYWLETFLLQRGIRKIPMSIQDSIMQALIGKTLYPKSDDYEMITDVKVMKKCMTFFAICRK
jgi:2-polyprenyl-3-methyl-5-hydroxy-6-metoxy-1,4-benzoquinol methylase